MHDLSDIYISRLLELEEFKELLELKNKINNECKMLIIGFKTKEARYLEALDHKEYYANFDEIKLDFINAKAKLYSNPYVKRYFELERTIQKIINDDMNELKEAISNKFTINKDIFEINF